MAIMRVPATSLALMILLPGIACAATPHFLGSSNRWIAARIGHGENRVCYAFTYALPDGTGTASTPAPHRDILIVSDYPDHPPEIALRAFYHHNGPVLVSVNLQHPAFFARDGYAFGRQHHRLIADFRKGAMVYATVPGPHQQRVTDQFSLMGFSKVDTILHARCGPPPLRDARRTIPRQHNDRSG
jgi:hypothetical protein